eukprot:g30461.t2
MDQLQTLQHLQAMTIRRLEEEPGVEHRLVVSRVSQHLQQMRMFLEKTLRASGVSSCVDLMGVTPGSIVLERESFIHMVLRNERILGDVSACGGGGASPRSARSAQSACQGISASFASGSRGGKGADQLGASLELRAFGEFLGARFPSLRAAMSAMDRGWTLEGSAAVSNSVVHFDLPAKRASFWVILALSNLAAFIVALPYVPLMVMWAKFTPKREMTFWMIMAQCSRQSGFLVGPAVFALLSQLVGRGKPIAPASALAWVLVAQVIIGYCSVMLHSMALPAQLPDDVERMEEDSSPGSLDGVEDSVDSLDILEREQVVASMIWYSFERSFVTAAIEVSTIMLLEVSYGWPSERCGLVFTVVSSTSLLLTWLSSMVMSRNSVPESTVFMVCKLTSLVGRVACFELESWLRQHMYPGNARMLLKDLGRKGSLGESPACAPARETWAKAVVFGGTSGGATAASLLRRLWGQSDLRARRYQPLEAQQAAIRCCRCICSFLNAAISVSLVDEPQDLHETASVAGTGRLGDQGLGTFQSVLSSRSRGEREPSLAEIGGRSKLEAVKGDVDKRRSMMHYRPSSARVPSEKLTPRNLRGKSHQQRRDAEKCIQTIRGRSLKQRLQSPPRSRSNSPTRSRTGSPVRRLLEIGEPVEDRLAPPPYVPPTASPSTTVAEAKEVEEQDSEAIGPVVRRRSQHLSHTVSAGSLQPSGSAQQLLLSRPCASRPLIRSPSAPPVVYTTLRSVAGAPSTPLTLAAPPVTVAAPIVRQVSLGRKELSPRVRWESDGPTPKAPVPSTGSLRRSTTLQMPATVRVSSTPCLTKAQSLPTTPLLPVTLNSISPSGSASNSPRFFVSGATPMNYRPPVTTVGPVMPLSGVTGTPVASVAATWAVFGEKTRGASAGPGRVRNGSPEVFGI